MSIGPITFWRVGLGFLLIAAALVGASPAAVTPASAVAPETDVSSSIALRPYVVRLAEDNVLVVADGPIADLAASAQQKQRDEIAKTLANFQANGDAGAATFDEGSNSFLVELSESAVGQLHTVPSIASVEASNSSASIVPTVAAPAPSTLFPHAMTTQNVSSVNFIQVYSPFMWGHTSVGGLSVQLELLDATGTFTVGVPIQTYLAAPNNYIKIDRTQLYYETIFVDPNIPSHPPVMIVPGEKVHVVTSGTDPFTGLPGSDDRQITVDDVQAWTSYQGDTVTGHTSLANAPVIVTTGSLGLSNYLTPGSSMTYATTSAGTGGSFSVSQFQTSTSSTLKTVDLQQGSNGFVRIKHVDGNEVYAIHGQNVLVLENSAVIHGYAFHLPSSPGGLDSGVAISHPNPSVTATLKNAQGGLLDTQTFVANAVPYVVNFTQMIVGGDIVEVSINQGPITQVTTSPLVAHVDLAGNQVVGSGPPNTSLTLGAGRIDGYITKSSSFSYIQKQVSTNGGGGYSSGPIQCGTSNQLSLQPGSFGYVGYEDGHGNFIYEAYAAPRNDVMANYPFVEGWVQDGTVRPLVTLRDPVGNLKSQSTATPVLLYLTVQKLFLNTYYNLTPAQFIGSGDTVSVLSGGQTATVPVDNLTAYVNTENSTISGTAPSGATAIVIPAKSRTTFKAAVASLTNGYSVANPFSSYSNGSCAVSTATDTFVPGDGGRTYLTHPDGNQVFAWWGRAMHVNENENFLELYLYLTQGVDWYSPSPVTTTVTLAPVIGASTTVVAAASGGLPGDTKVSLINPQAQKTLIRAGDTLTAIFIEGPPGGPSQAATVSLAGIPLITGSPDVTTSTVAGVGPPNWVGNGTLNSPPSAKPVPIPTRSSTAYSPLRFVSTSNVAIPLVLGYSGVVSFTDTFGHRVWSAWAVTAYPVKIIGYLKPGDTLVCGKATAGVGITILDATNQPLAVPIGTGVADGQGNFCVTVSPPLYLNEVILAQDSNGTLSQPVIVRDPLFLPLVIK